MEIAANHSQRASAVFDRGGFVPLFTPGAVQMLKRNLDKIVTAAAVIAFVGAVVAALVVWLRVKDEEVKDWQTFNLALTGVVIGLTGLFVPVLTLALKVWESVVRVECIPTRYDHDVGNYFAVKVYNSGAVPAHVDEVELTCRGNRTTLKRMEGDAVLAPKQAAMYSITTEFQAVATMDDEVIVWGPGDRVLAKVKGKLVYEALAGQMMHVLTTLERRGQLQS